MRKCTRWNTYRSRDGYENGSSRALTGGEKTCQPRLAVPILVFKAQTGPERSLAALCDNRERFDVFIVDDESEPPIEISPCLPLTGRLTRLPQNGGIRRTLNAGLPSIMEEGYECIARLGAGDISLPGRFAAQMVFLGAHPNHAVVGTHAEFVDGEGKHIFVHSH